MRDKINDYYSRVIVETGGSGVVYDFSVAPAGTLKVIYCLNKGNHIEDISSFQDLQCNKAEIHFLSNCIILFEFGIYLYSQKNHFEFE